MSLLFWFSLVLLGAVMIGGIALIAVRAIELYRVFRSCGRVIAAGAERILNASEALEQRAARDPAQIAEARERLERSLHEAAPLLREVGRLRAKLAGAKAAVPRK
jgi:hypothetical protein